MLGCDEEPAPEEVAPKVIDVSVAGGSRVPANSIITVTFNKEMESVQIDVSCAAGNTTLKRTWRGEIKATWTPSPYSPPGFETLPWTLWNDIPLGPHTLTVTGRDKSGQELQGFTPINFIATGPD